MGAREGGGKEGTCPFPWNLKKNEVICCRPTKYPKFFARAFGARHIYPIFQSKMAQKFSFTLSALRKTVIFCMARRKRVNFLKYR